ncbi:zonadhesin-like [Hyla sarda]|uniref:zonadhesin-like n=1 Tax=Hyla sarda TaxID=327740 RepID=UPI0024C2A504|nr:zonadhesin-like [Hyla sarda]
MSFASKNFGGSTSFTNVNPKSISQFCPPGAKWSTCSNCDDYCQPKNILCTAVCKKGCVCTAEGYKLYNNTCIPADQCPSEVSKPGPILSCPRDTEESNCTGCQAECPINNKKCTTSCQRGCKCKIEGYFLHNGACFPRSQCPYRQQDGNCPDHMQHKFCSDCEDYCPIHGQKCIKKCRMGCVCKEGFLMHYGKCVHKSGCPQEFSFVESCPKETKWKKCVPCKAHCFPESDCKKKCIQGCICKDKNLVFYAGHCITREECPLLPH